MAITEADAAQICRAGGWDYIENSNALRAICGSHWGIAHVATINGEANHSDSVYDNFVACWRAQFASEEESGRLELRDAMAPLIEALGELGANQMGYLSSAEAKAFHTACDLLVWLENEISGEN